MLSRIVIIALALGMLPGIALGQHRPREYRVTLAKKDQARAGASRTLSLSITPQPGYAISRQAPLLVTVTTKPGHGVDVPRMRYLRRHAADSRADAPRFDLYYQSVQPGQYTLIVDMRFWVCGRATCWPERETRVVGLDIHTAEP